VCSISAESIVIENAENRLKTDSYGKTQLFSTRLFLATASIERDLHRI
jgi:hypothetical protein